MGRLGKSKRIRQVLVYATDRDSVPGLASRQCHRVATPRRGRISRIIVDVRWLRSQSPALRRAFARLGYDLDGSGGLRPLVLDNLSGTQLTKAAS